MNYKIALEILEIEISDKNYNVGNLDNINIKEINICEVSTF